MQFQSDVKIFLICQLANYKAHELLQRRSRVYNQHSKLDFATDYIIIYIDLIVFQTWKLQGLHHVLFFLFIGCP